VPQCAFPCARAADFHTITSILKPLPPP